MNREETLKTIQGRADKLGDLPIFNTSVNRVRKISTDPDADALELAQEVMKDSNFTIKLLRLANSSYYNRGTGKISSISRAVVLLGFESIKNLVLTMKLIESFQKKTPGVDLIHMIVNAYLTAGFAREIAFKCGIKDVEESYVCGLLHNLGEIATAYFLPEAYQEIERLKKSGLKSHEAERQLLGMTFHELSRALATSWEFSSPVIKSMDDYLPAAEGSIKNSIQLNRALAALSSDAIKCLFHPERAEKPLSKVLSDLSKASGVDNKGIEKSLDTSFKMSCDLADQYGLQRKILQPPLRQDTDELRNNIAHQFSYYANQSRPDDTHTLGTPEAAAGVVQPAPKLAATPPTGPIAPATAHSLHADQQLEIIQEITELITASASANLIFMKVLEGIYSGVGLERVVLCLLSADRRSYQGRLALGRDADLLKRYFAFPLTAKGDLFSRLILEGEDLYIENINHPPVRAVMQPDFASQIKAQSFIVSALRRRDKPVGMIYADNAISGRPITADEIKGFKQFATQARLALLTQG